jgi:hypothetical protein
MKALAGGNLRSFSVMRRNLVSVHGGHSSHSPRWPNGCELECQCPPSYFIVMGSEIPPSLREIAQFQSGIVTRKQALHAGLSTGSIVSKLRFGRWRQIYRGVYATFTGPLHRKAELWAAVLYAGAGAELSHETAAELYGFADRRAAVIHVSVPHSRRVQPVRGLLIHISVHVGSIEFPPPVLPCTSIENTIIDLVDSAIKFDDVCGWVTRAFVRGLTSDRALRMAARTRKRLRWRTEFGQMVAAASRGAHSVLEFRYDRDVERAHGLPAADHQVPFTKPGGARGFRDRYYGRYGLVVELDGKEAHPAEDRWTDIGRDNAATASADSTLRYGWNDVTRDACTSAAQVASSLRKRGWAGQLKPCSLGCAAAEILAEMLAETPATPARQSALEPGSRPSRLPAPAPGRGAVRRDNGAESARTTMSLSVRSGKTACAPAATRSAAG